MRGAPAALLLSLLAGCSPPAPEKNEASPEPAVAPAPKLANATLEPSGFPTILYAEPAMLGEPLPVRPPAPGAPDPAATEAVRNGRDASPYLRIFPVMDRETGPMPLEPRYGTLQLRDGCLRMTSVTGDADGKPLAVFPPGTRAFIDTDNYLSIGRTGDHAPPPVRVGEELVFTQAPPVTDAELIAAVREACGEGPLLWINDPTSFYTQAHREAAWNAPRAAEIHGVSVAVARREMLEELQENEARRRRCTVDPEESCGVSLPEPGEPIDSWLMVWPAPPPPAPPPPPSRQ